MFQNDPIYLITTVRCMCHIKDSISLVVKRRRLTWLGHVKDEFRCQTWDRIVNKETKSRSNNVRHSIGTIRDWFVG